MKSCRRNRCVLCANVFLLLCTFSLGQTVSSAPFNAQQQRIRVEQWLSRARRTPGNTSAALRYRAYQQKMRMRSQQQLQSPQISTSGWSPLGPAPLASDASGIGLQDYNWVSGRATAVAIDASDPTANTVYAGGAYGGVWKTTNALQSVGTVVWNPLIDNQATLAVGAIAIQPQLSNPDPTRSVLVVGTGEANSCADSYYGLGILRSSDAGNTWTLISEDSTGTQSFAGMSFSEIAFSTTSPNIAVAASADSLEGISEGLSTSNLGLYYSTNGGLSWTYATVQDGSIATIPASATTVTFNATAGSFFAALRYHGFYSSTDGIHWSRLTNQPGAGLTAVGCPAQSNNTGCPIFRGEVAVVPGRNEMYAWYIDANDNDQGIWTSTNGGVSWSPINEAGILNCGDEQGCGTEQGTYNLELAAVPNGTATDLYAGSINLYKCHITSAVPDCSGTGANTFLNLTHAYGCSDIARVHPAQHALSFLLVNNNQQDVMVFANDGGVYRTLDGYSGLSTGSCGSSNLFDSLNQTLGSMTQLVSFSQAPGDPNTILGGSQGNGSPATQSALASSTWLNVDGGDGSYTQIDPENADDWFVSNPSDSGVSIFRCESGINCHTQDFQADEVVTSSTLGGDIGAYYSPYLLDPQNSSELLVGTCRVWRGSSSGTNFSSLSANFENGGDGICTGQETNLVNSLAAGGPLDSNGLSNVVYAGTNGFGPLNPTYPTGGRVWVTSDAAEGSSTWADRTGSINPAAFPISDIALDTSDSTGLTAYVSIQGFDISHVWKTSNGGSSWTDFTANLPDAPVNALFVDPGSNPTTGTLYAATDVGVFSTFTSSASWAEVGPPPSSGQQGYLPNVAVTALRMLITGSDKFLRASTYGRGIWQFPIITHSDYLVSISNTPLTVFAGTDAVFDGTALALDGYNNSVQLSCISGATSPPSICQPTPASVTPTVSGTVFNVTAGGSDGSYSFNVQGVGGDSNHMQHTAAVTLNVVDFSLSTPSPAAITVEPGKTSPLVSFAVSAAGPFDQVVSLSCSGLPSGATCNFQPSQVTPTPSTPASASLTIGTDSNTVPGTFSVGINGTAVNGPTRSQTLSFTVTKDYAITISNPSLTAYENTNATYNGILTSLNGYGSPVNLSCGTGAPSTCTASPSTLIPTSTGTPFTVTVSSNTCGQFDFGIHAVGTDPAQISHSAGVIFTSNSLARPDYTLEISNPSLTAPVNSAAVFTGVLTATACYSSPVNLSCGSGAPPHCAASPASLVPTVNGSAFTVSVSSDTVASYNFSIAGQGSDPPAIRRVAVVTFSSITATSSGFSLNNTSGPESVAAGQSATFSLNLAPSSGTFPYGVSLLLSGCPPLSECTLNPAQVAAGKGSTAVQLDVQTTAPTVAKLSPAHTWRALCALCLFIPGMLLASVSRSGEARRKQTRWFLPVIALVWISGMLACGGGLEGGSTAPTIPGTPSGSYTMTVAASMNSAPGSPSKTAQVTLVIQ